MKSTATLMESILSASLSGISNLNSSSRAMTTSTASKLSRPRSFLKWASGVTYRSLGTNWLTICHQTFTLAGKNVTKHMSQQHLLIGILQIREKKITGVRCLNQGESPLAAQNLSSSFFFLCIGFLVLSVSHISTITSSKLDCWQKWVRAVINNSRF